MQGKQVGDKFFLKDVGLKGWVEVSKEEFDKQFPSKPIGAFGLEAAWKKPILSDAIAVHPSQIEEAMAHDARHGVPTEYDREYGRPKFLSREHQLRYLKAHKAHNNGEIKG